MRGTPYDGHCTRPKRRIIPAHAGNTGVAFLCDVPCGDHPRACGEHSPFFGCQFSVSGSSPRMRGTQYASATKVSYMGIIPAHAGNTKPTATHSHRHSGSSPRMRGTLHRVAVRRAEPGIIPAHAGNTVSRICQNGVLMDHPRACGEHRHLSFLARRPLGSSPRMRGTRGSVLFRR